MARKLAALFSASVLLPLAFAPAGAAALDLDTTSTASITEAAKAVADSLMNTYYNASSTAGTSPRRRLGTRQTQSPSHKPRCCDSRNAS